MSHQEAEHPSYQIHTGQVKEAIETLEGGRGLLWSEIRGFHASIDHLSTVDPSLAETFAGVNRDLESLTTSNPQGLMVDNREVKGDERTDEFGRISTKQRELLDKRNILISEIRSLPEFEDFLTSPLFDTLSAVPACGPVIVINHSAWRSDIIILLHDSPPSLITTSDDFFDRAKGLKDQLLEARKEGLDSTEYQDALTSVLENPLRSRWPASDPEAPGAECTRTISLLVVSDICILFSSSARYGSYSIGGPFQVVFFGPVHPFVYSNPFGAHLIQKA